jgi:hypothetical protein
MRRRNCSLTESLEPRLVLSALSPRGSVDAPDEKQRDDAPRDEVVADDSVHDEQATSASRLLDRDDVGVVPGANDSVLIPSDSTDTSELDFDDESNSDSVDETGLRSLTLDDDSASDDLSDDSLSTDDGGVRDDTNDAADTGTDGRTDSIDEAIDSRHKSSTVGGSKSTASFGIETRANVRLVPGIRDVRWDLPPVHLPAAPSLSAMASESVAGENAGSWISSLADSLKSWLSLEGLGTVTVGVMSNAGVPCVALAGGFSLVAVGRKGFSETEAFESDDSGFGCWKADRRSGRPSERRRFRWFGFATKDKRQRPAGEVSTESRSTPNLSDPDLSDAFVMSLMDSVGNDAFVLSPIAGQDDTGADAEGSRLSVELVAAGAATVVGGTCVARRRMGRRQTLVRPMIDYSGTTLPR